MDQTEKQDDALFDALNRKKKKQRRRIIRTAVIVILILALALAGGVWYLRRRVAQRVSSRAGEVLSAEASVGSISTQVSGSGTLMNVDEESLSIPAGVTVEEVLVSAHDSVSEGQLLVKTEPASVLTAMSSLQSSLSSLDSEITAAGSDSVSSTITAGVAGRIKQIYARQGDDIASCMYEHGALAVLSLDGYMATEIKTSVLNAGDAVTLLRADDKEIKGTVDSVQNGTATILVSDNGPAVDEKVRVLDGEGGVLGSGRLAIHSPMRISGITGTVAYVYAAENQNVYAGSTLFTLTSTAYTARYQTLLKQREELEDTLIELMGLYQYGGVTAPFAGSVSSVDYDETAVSEELETALVTLSPDQSMQVTINVDESNILSLELGQSASVTVSSIGEDAFSGAVTEINKTASSTSGVTRYSAVVTLDKSPEMLQGMSASVVIRIQGVEDAVIIPIEALHQTSASSYVYTRYDEETQEFGGLVEVTAGITNSSYAEITSGLKAGDTVYYTRAQTNPFSGRGGYPGAGAGVFGSGNNSGYGGNTPSGSGSFNGGYPGGGTRPNSGGFGGNRAGFPGGRG
ncbi:MAG: efflux RND transporter periplasmic adaptor subunit [Oscillospiraceae bacterium]|nr:efflux RND transporter periplasmic adaptor subunit [Oscillospiraceae bacterium]